MRHAEEQKHRHTETQQLNSRTSGNLHGVCAWCVCVCLCVCVMSMSMSVSVCMLVGVYVCVCVCVCLSMCVCRSRSSLFSDHLSVFTNASPTFVSLKN